MPAMTTAIRTMNLVLLICTTTQHLSKQEEIEYEWYCPCYNHTTEWTDVDVSPGITACYPRKWKNGSFNLGILLSWTSFVGVWLYVCPYHHLAWLLWSGQQVSAEEEIWRRISPAYGYKSDGSRLISEWKAYAWTLCLDLRINWCLPIKLHNRRCCPFTCMHTTQSSCITLSTVIFFNPLWCSKVGLCWSQLFSAD